MSSNIYSEYRRSERAQQQLTIRRQRYLTQRNQLIAYHSKLTERQKLFEECKASIVEGKKKFATGTAGVTAQSLRIMRFSKVQQASSRQLKIVRELKEKILSGAKTIKALDLCSKELVGRAREIKRELYSQTRQGETLDLAVASCQKKIMESDIVLQFDQMGQTAHDQGDLENRNRSILDFTAEPSSGFEGIVQSSCLDQRTASGNEFQQQALDSDAQIKQQQQRQTESEGRNSLGEAAEAGNFRVWRDGRVINFLLSYLTQEGDRLNLKIKQGRAGSFFVSLQAGSERDLKLLRREKMQIVQRLQSEGIRVGELQIEDLKGAEECLI